MAEPHVRADRLPPNAQLGQHGIVEMPRYIRRDNVYGRYTYRDHPNVDVGAGTGAGVQCIGTRCSDASEASKYLDCLNKYVVALEKWGLGETHDCALARRQIEDLQKRGVVVVAGAGNAAYEDVPVAE